MAKKIILVTGGSGYVGSHVCIELIKAKYDVVIVDNLSNSSVESIKRVEKIVNKKIPFYKIDIRDKKALTLIFEKYLIDGVIHLAGFKAVNESVENPIDYYENNLGGALVLIQVMRAFGSKTLVFSSSATVYGDPETVPIKENFPLSSTNPYGRSKLMIEGVLKDIFSSDNSWKIAILRYFNPVGAHKSGLIGENPNDLPNNLMPCISQVAIGKLKKLKVFGDDYDTPDGSGVRDYIHVEDLANGHVKALQALVKHTQVLTVNLGTGIGYSVFEIIKAFEKASGNIIPYEVLGRRKGDVASCYSDPSYALKKLGWKANSKIDKMCEDTWRWQVTNPNGFNSK
jgi:UDP-glucose 4-epimerase